MTMWWWGPGPWLAGFALMAAFMLLCGVFMIGTGGMRGMSGVCAWWRGREDDDAHRIDAADGARDSSDGDEEDRRLDRRLAR